MVADFLHQRGLQRLYRLLVQNRDDLNGVLFGQLMNLAIYSSTPVFIQAPLVGKLNLCNIALYFLSGN